MDDAAAPAPRPDLAAVLAGLEDHVAAAGWDQPPRLFALVDTAELREREPALAAGLAAEGPLTAVEQDQLTDTDLERALGRIAWPATVAGTALVHEVLVLPPEAELELPDRDPAGYAAVHPRRREVRMAVAVLRDGAQACRLRLRADPSGPESVLAGPQLAPGLAAALRATLAD